MEANMWAIGSIIKSMGSASTFGKMAASTSASGSTTICMVSAFTSTRMAIYMKGSTSMTGRKATVFTIGRMEGSTKAGGTRASSTASVPISIFQSSRHGTVFGNMANGLSGIMKAKSIK